MTFLKHRVIGGCRGMPNFLIVSLFEVDSEATLESHYKS